MASRRNRPGANAFGDTGPEPSLAEVDSALFGGIRRADAETPKVRPVNVRDIQVDEAIQVRVEHLVSERVETLCEVLLNGGTFRDPIVVCRDDNGALWLADGFHRVAAYRQALNDPERVKDLEPLKAEIRPGGYQAAWEYSEEANLQHGEPLTKDDLKNLLFRRLKRGHDWKDASNRMIAKALGVSHPTVATWIEEYKQGNGKHFPLKDEHEKKIVTESGQTRDISGVIKANKKRAKQGPTTTQIKRAVVKHLRAAGEGLARLDNYEGEAQQVGDWADGLEKEWKL